MATKTTNSFTVTIEPCICGSTRGFIELEQEGSLQVPIVHCAECKIEVDHTIYSVRSAQ